MSLVIALGAGALGAGRGGQARQRWLSIVMSVTLWTFVGLVDASGSVLRAAMAQLTRALHCTAIAHIQRYPRPRWFGL